ncbi:MAG TPA: hypothetical protein PKB10_14880, partial [Tepidisphaeraceae bacterium]|nr:hypothetical protein [Tepidisphaeraceae bacterium]
EPRIDFSAHHYTAHDLAAAKHPHELVRRPEVVLNLDHAQNGIGTASCGPAVLEAYKLRPQAYRFSIWFAGLRPGEDALVRSRQLPALPA